jgi:hypothetical protein
MVKLIRHSFISFLLFIFTKLHPGKGPVRVSEWGNTPIMHFTLQPTLQLHTLPLCICWPVRMHFKQITTKLHYVFRNYLSTYF